MSTKPTLPRPRLATSFVAATLAGVIAIGILGAVTAGFLRGGKPMERLLAAERACVAHAYVSEREACMNDWLAAARAPRVAGK